jgi:hypothetical protein
MHGWTPERRAAQAAAIHRWRPWQSSTGPRSAAGKARVSRNGYQGGHRPRTRELARVLRRLLGDERQRFEHARAVL